MLRNLTLFVDQYSHLRRFQRLDRAERSFIFYAESEAYWSYLGPVIVELVERYHQKICYLTSSPDDPLLKSQDQMIRAFYIGSKLIRTILFASLDADLMVMTTPSLGIHYLRRSRHPVHYAYLPHNLISTHSVFEKGAFNYFDTVFCVGAHQVGELREAEKIYDLQPKNLVECGYVKLDQMMNSVKSCHKLSYANEVRILIAPSWSKDGFLANGTAELIGVLISVGHEVVLRPHRQSYVLDPQIIQKIDQMFSSHPKFFWARDLPSDDVLNESHLIISDWSGSAFSFAFGYERPVIFINCPQKINNSDFARFRSPTMEQICRSEVGEILEPDEIKRAPEIVSKICSNITSYTNAIRGSRSKYVFQIGDSAACIAKYIMDKFS